MRQHRQLAAIDLVVIVEGADMDHHHEIHVARNEAAMGDRGAAHHRRLEFVEHLIALRLQLDRHHHHDAQPQHRHVERGGIARDGPAILQDLAAARGGGAGQIDLLTQHHIRHAAIMRQRPHDAEIGRVKVDIGLVGHQQSPLLMKSIARCVTAARKQKDISGGCAQYAFCAGPSLTESES
jgi:hypothetical protein